MSDVWAAHQGDVVEEDLGGGDEVFNAEKLGKALSETAKNEISGGDIDVNNCSGILGALGFDNDMVEKIETGVNFSHSDLMKNNAAKPKDDEVEETEASSRIIISETESEVVEVVVEGDKGEEERPGSNSNTPSRNTAKEEMIKTQPRSPLRKPPSAPGGNEFQSRTETHSMPKLEPPKPEAPKKAWGNVQVMGRLATEAMKAATIPEDLLYIPNYDRKKKKKEKKKKKKKEKKEGEGGREKG